MKLNMESGSGLKNSGHMKMKNLKLLRKRPGAPEYVREFAKLIKELAKGDGDEERFGWVG